jgi:hypothetical protein
MLKKKRGRRTGEKWKCTDIQGRVLKKRGNAYLKAGMSHDSDEAAVFIIGFLDKCEALKEMKTRERNRRFEKTQTHTVESDLAQGLPNQDTPSSSSG